MTVKIVECLVCNQELEYSGDNTEVLLQHLNHHHSHTEVFRFLADDQKSSKLVQGVKKSLSQVIKWNPLRSLECPYCRQNHRPIIKKKDQSGGRIMSNLFWCWPMCCSPSSSKKDLVGAYCANCNKYIGEYDPQTGKLTRTR